MSDAGHRDRTPAELGFHPPWTPTEIARCAGVSRAYVWEFIRAGTLVAFSRGRVTRIRHHEAVRFIESFGAVATRESSESSASPESRGGNASGADAKREAS